MQLLLALSTCFKAYLRVQQRNPEVDESPRGYAAVQLHRQVASETAACLGPVCQQETQRARASCLCCMRYASLHGARLSDLLQWAWSSHADTHMSLQGFGVSSDEDQDLSGDDGELFHSIRACALRTTMLW